MENIKKTKEIHHKNYSMVIGNSTSTVYEALNLENNPYKTYNSLLKDKIDSDNKNIRSELSVLIFYNIYTHDGTKYCDWINYNEIPLHIYLSGIWATKKYLQIICNKYNLNISDFKKRIENNEIIYEYFHQNFEKI